jgi:hypothetical protein
MKPKAVTEVTVGLDPEIYEAQNVHAIYDKIASHFSSTRYKVIITPAGHHLIITHPVSVLT